MDYSNLTEFVRSPNFEVDIERCNWCMHPNINSPERYVRGFEWYETGNIRYALKIYGCAVLNNAITEQQANNTMHENFYSSAVLTNTNWTTFSKESPQKYAKGCFGFSSNQSSVTQLENRQTPRVACGFAACYQDHNLVVNHSSIHFQGPRDCTSGRPPVGHGDEQWHINVEPTQASMNGIAGFCNYPRPDEKQHLHWSRSLVVEGGLVLTDGCTFESLVYAPTIPDANEVEDERNFLSKLSHVTAKVTEAEKNTGNIPRRVLNLQKGSLVLWNALLYHRFSKNMLASKSGDWRGIQYICMLPRRELVHIGRQPVDFHTYGEATREFHPSPLGMHLFGLTNNAEATEYMRKYYFFAQNNFCSLLNCANFAEYDSLCEEHDPTIIGSCDPCTSIRSLSLLAWHWNPGVELYGYNIFLLQTLLAVLGREIAPRRWKFHQSESDGTRWWQNQHWMVPYITDKPPCGVYIAGLERLKTGSIFDIVTENIQATKFNPHQWHVVYDWQGHPLKWIKNKSNMEPQAERPFFFTDVILPNTGEIQLEPSVMSAKGIALS